MDNQKNYEAIISFGEVMRTAGKPTQQPYNKRMAEDTRQMLLCQGMRTIFWIISSRIYCSICARH